MSGTGKIRVGIAGHGDQGVPLAIAFGQAGLDVVLYDPDKTKRNAIREGRGSDGNEIPALRELVAAGRVTASTDEVVLHHVGLVVVADVAHAETAERQRRPDAWLLRAY